jgi:hypothetical protein
MRPCGLPGKRRSIGRFLIFDGLLRDIVADELYMNHKQIDMWREDFPREWTWAA